MKGRKVQYLVRYSVVWCGGGTKADGKTTQPFFYPQGKKAAEARYKCIATVQYSTVQSQHHLQCDTVRNTRSTRSIALTRQQLHRVRHGTSAPCLRLRQHAPGSGPIFLRHFAGAPHSGDADHGGTTANALSIYVATGGSEACTEARITGTNIFSFYSLLHAIDRTF